MMTPPRDLLAQSGFKAEDIERIDRYRQRHRDLYQRWTSRQLTPRQLRIELVKYYQMRGKQALDERFFPMESDSTESEK